MDHRSAAEVGDVGVRVVKPRNAAAPLPVTLYVHGLYVHGGGWIPGNAGTHDRLVRELAVGARTAVAFIEYDRSPEAHYPLHHPVADTAQDTASYRQFADGPFLSAKAMAWFWDAYTADPEQRAEATALSLRAAEEKLSGLPPALVIVDENDVLRDEGEAYARRLSQAGVPTTCVRCNGIIHDFMMLNPVRPTQASTAAIAQAIHTLRKALGTN